MSAKKEWLRISYSSLNTFESCARKYELDKLYPHRRIRDDAFAADVGSALHAGYQDFLIHQDRERATWKFMEAYPYELATQQKFDDRSVYAALATLDEMMDSIQMMDYELAHIIRPPTIAELAADANAKPVQVPAIEVPFEIRFSGIELAPTPKYPNGCGISFIGYIDAILRNIITEMYKTTDIKTHRRHLKDATAKYKFDAQQVPYGIVVDHIAGNRVEQFEVNYLDCYVDLLDPRVVLYPFLKSQEDLQEWLTTMVLKIQQLQRYAELQYFPRTTGGCLFYNRPCRYLDPCSSRDPELLQQWFLMGEEAGAGKEEEFQPWILTEIDPFAGADS